MGACGSADRQEDVLELVLQPHFAERLRGSNGLRQRVLAALPQGLATAISRRALFSTLRLEEDRLLNAHFYRLLDMNGDGFVTLQELLAQLAQVASGRPPLYGSAKRLPTPGPRDWEQRADALQLQAAFAFRLLDLDDDGRITELELRDLAHNSQGPSTKVGLAMRAIGGGETGHHAGGVTFERFMEFTGSSPNTLFPAFCLQQLLSKRGLGAAASLAALRELFGERG